MDSRRHVVSLDVAVFQILLLNEYSLSFLSHECERVPSSLQSHSVEVPQCFHEFHGCPRRSRWFPLKCLVSKHFYQKDHRLEHLDDVGVQQHVP